MAERDVGSTFLLPHTHLYKPDRVGIILIILIFFGFLIFNYFLIIKILYKILYTIDFLIGEWRYIRIWFLLTEFFTRNRSSYKYSGFPRNKFHLVLGEEVSKEKNWEKYNIRKSYLYRFFIAFLRGFNKTCHTKWCKKYFTFFMFWLLLFIVIHNFIVFKCIYWN